MTMTRLIFGMMVGFLLLSCSGGEGPIRESGQPGVIKSGPLSVFDLLAGDCLADPSVETIPSEVEELEAVPCNEVHRLEIFTLIAVETDDDLYPGEGALTAKADAGCLASFPEYVGVDYFAQSSLYFTYIYPTLDSWTGNSDRSIVCVVGSSEQLNGSVKGVGGNIPLAEIES